jgi:hypothetical protein
MLNNTFALLLHRRQPTKPLSTQPPHNNPFTRARQLANQAPSHYKFRVTNKQHLHFTTIPQYHERVVRPPDKLAYNPNEPAL